MSLEIRFADVDGDGEREVVVENYYLGGNTNNDYRRGGTENRRRDDRSDLEPSSKRQKKDDAELNIGGESSTTGLKKFRKKFWSKSMHAFRSGFRSL